MLCSNKDFWNGTNIRSLDSEVPVFNHRILTEEVLSDVSLEKVNVYFYIVLQLVNAFKIVES